MLTYRSGEKTDTLALIKSKVDKLSETGEIDDYSRVLLEDMTKRVVTEVAIQSDPIQKGVTEIMGGQVLEHRAKTIYNDGLSKGLAKGRAEGYERGVQAVVDICKGYGGSSVDAVEKVVANMGLSREEADRMVMKYW